jgi:retron-type reverse transcriptase
MSKTDLLPINTVEWNEIDWRKVEKSVFKLQKRIYQASIKSNCPKVKTVTKNPFKKCFDRINHTKLLEKVNTFPKIRRQIKAWLKSGILDQQELLLPTEGTPQGGICSPLLANIALHGMEERIKELKNLLLPGKESKEIIKILFL